MLEEDQNKFVIVQPNNEPATIVRADIVKQETLATSAMPPFGSAMSANDLAALVAWLMKP